MFKYNCKNIIHALMILLISLVIINNSFAQIYSFAEIKEIFFRERPQTGNLTIREDCFGSIDDLILGTYPPLHPDTKMFYKFMLEKAIIEIKTEVVTEGATIWQIYNHGFVVKTPSKTFGFDLKDYFNIKDFLDLADILDVYFISHEHGDHYSTSLINAMKALGKPVVGPAEWYLVPVKMNSGDTMTIAGLSVTAHYGLHSVPVRQFEIITPEGLKFLHTGDNQDSATLPDVTNINVMLLNCWINDSGAIAWIEGVRKAIDIIRPDVTLPGHMIELGHLGSRSPPVPYRDPIASNNGSLASEYYMLGWGERYHYDNNSNDSIKPGIVENLTYHEQQDTILFSWDIPQIASDGDSASFYRIIINSYEEHLITDKQFETNKSIYSFKVYSYDDCGNQSDNYAEIDLSGGSVQISHIQLSPASFAFLAFDEQVDISFNYSTIEEAGICIFTHPFSNGTLTPNSSSNNSPIYPVGSGSGTGYFIVISGETTVDQVRFQAWNAEKSELLLEFLIPTRYWVHDFTDNLLVNGDYSLGDTGWDFTTYGLGHAQGSVNDAGEYAISISDGGTEVYHIQLTQPNLLIEKGIQYTVTFEAYAVSLREIKSVVLHNGQPWTNYSNYETFSVTTQKQQFTHSFVMNEQTDPFARFDLYAGLSTADVFFDNVILKEEQTPTARATELSQIPKSFKLLQNYPNPFNPVTTISYDLPHESYVTLMIYDITGRLVKTLVNDRQSAGYYTLQWDATNAKGQPVSAGVYFYQIRAVDFVQTRKMVLLK